MNGRLPPLLELFYELRARNLDLGPAEYLQALRALGEGVVTNRQQLVWLCQALWGKSVEEQELIGAMLTRALPRQITAEYLASLTQEAEQPTPPPPATAKTNDPPPERRDARPPPARESRPQTEQRVELSPLETDHTPTHPVSSPRDTPRIVAFPTDLVGELATVRRQMKRSWRYYRRMGRQGRAIELDLDATIVGIQRKGRFAPSVLVPHRRNLAEILLLIDQGGSMNPFAPWVSAWTEAGHHAGLGRFEVLYFSNIPSTCAFRDASLSQPVDLWNIVGRFKDPAVLIVSDAGAARRRYMQRRVASTLRFLGELTTKVGRVAWLNPAPAQRWPGSSAESIAQAWGVPMYPMTRGGQDAAMRTLKGRA